MSDVAIILQGSLPADPILYDVLGGASPGHARASLVDLCCLGSFSNLERSKPHRGVVAGLGAKKGQYGMCWPASVPGSTTFAALSQRKQSCWHWWQALFIIPSCVWVHRLIR